MSLGPNQVFRVSVLVLQPIFATYCLGSLLEPSDEIVIYAIDMLRNCTQ